MTYIGVIASAVLHVGGLFLLLTARAPDPLIPMGTDTPVAVDIISLDEYNALVSRAPSRSTLAALRSQPEPPRAPVVTDANPIVDTLDEQTPVPQEPEPTTELAMRLPPEIQDVPLQAQEEPPAPETSNVEVAPPPDPLALDTDALQDRGVDPADLIPNDDVQVAIAPPAPEPPRGVFDAPIIDTDPDEPPKLSETEGDGEEQAKPAPEPEPMMEKPVETAKAEDLAPLATPLPIPKPRGSLTVASEEEREPAQVAEAPLSEPPLPQPPVVEQAPAAPEPKPEPEPDLQLTEAELEEERQMMAALMEQMRANQPPSEAELRAAEEEARRKFAEEQQRLAEIAALDDAQRRLREEADRAKAAAEAAAEAEIERRAQELADAQAREIAELRAREAAQLRAQQEAALEAQRELEEARRRQAAEAQRLAREQYERAQAEEAARQQAIRDRAARRQQLAELNANIAPEARANNVITGTTPSQNPIGGSVSALDRVFAAANVAAGAATTRSSFGQGGGSSRGASLTPGETQAVLNQLRRCWRVDTFSANANSLVVTLRAQIRQNGFVNQATIDIVSPNPVPVEYQIAVDRARTALQDLRCQPFSLPANKYNAWRDIVIRFDPAQMVLQ